MAGYDDYQTEEEYVAAEKSRLPAVDWEALTREAVYVANKVKDCIERQPKRVIGDTIWMPDDVFMGGTLFDFVDAFLDRARKAGVS